MHIRSVCTSLVAVSILAFHLVSVTPGRAATRYVYRSLRITSYTDEARAINNLSVVVGTWDHPSAEIGGYYLWNSATTTPPNPLTAEGVVLSAIDDTGTAIGVGRSGRPFRRAPDGTITDLPPLPAGYTGAVVGDINASGVVVGAFVKSGGHDPFRYANGQYTVLPGYPGATSTIFHGINDAGQIVGEYRTGTTTGGFRYVNGTYTAYPAFIPHDINNRGVIVGTRNGTAGQIDENGTVTPFLFPDYVDDQTYHATEVLHVNDAGVLVGRISAITGLYHAFIAVPLAPVTTADVAKALRIGGGLTPANTVIWSDLRRLNIRYTPGALTDAYASPLLNLIDAGILARQVGR